MERLTRRPPERVLITRLSAIGDCILTIPLAVRVKQLWPKCNLSWVVDCASDSLLEAHPVIDEVIRIERDWLKRPSEWLWLRGELHKRELDLVLDPQGLTKSALLGWLSGAPERVGFDFSHAREIAPFTYTRRIKRTARHMVDSYLELLNPWTEIVSGQGEFQMPHYQAAGQVADALLNSCDLANQDWCAINPGAGWSTRQWPVTRFGMLAREIYREHGRRSLVFWAGESELLMAKVIEEESQGAAIVAPRTSLAEMLELLRRCSLLVTGDTGPLHMASSIGAPCVSLHGPTWSDESGPYRNRHMAIQSPTPNLTKKLIRKGPNTAMQAIELNEVYRACRQMFDAEASLKQCAEPSRIAG